MRFGLNHVTHVVTPLMLGSFTFLLNSTSPTTALAPLGTPTPIPTAAPSSTPSPTPAKLADREFSSAEFAGYFTQLDLPNTHEITTPPAITYNSAADNRIRLLAESGGYRLQKTALDNLVPINSHQLQPVVKTAWIDLQENAARAGIQLGLVSTHRSIETQRQLFLSRLHVQSRQFFGQDYSYDDVASGVADTAVLFTLSGTAPPGYSKHHTGYAIDITDLASGKTYTQFAETAGYAWISENNFYHAKEHGFIPSYPDTAEEIGPRPEPWEFVWVGE